MKRFNNYHLMEYSNFNDVGGWTLLHFMRYQNKENNSYNLYTSTIQQYIF